ncbi:MAG: DUF4173 domain-containing protein [Flavobacteriales bacterium]|nr:DUF4173 domain-containing protein [Flavobacteriales bacterium]
MSTIVTTPTTRKALLPLITVVVGTAIFDLLFWERSPGLNFALFNLVIAGFLLQRYTWAGLSAAARWSLLAAVVAGAMVYVHDTIIAIFASIVTLATATAYAHEPRLRSLFVAGLQSVANFMVTPLIAVTQLDRLAPPSGAPRSGLRWMKLGVLPVAVLLLFTQLYRAGNPKFDALTAGFMNGLFEVFEDFFAEIFTAHTLFMVFGAVLCGALLLRLSPEALVRMEQGWKDALIRTRTRRPHWLAPRSMDPLERERRMGMILLVAVNLLLAVVNVIDIDWVWFGFEVPRDFSLKQFVHEGTWMLIISMLLSMLLLMYLFRRNQNFYWRSKGLKVLAIAWVLQNIILGISVFLRNYHYISFHGLAYKRIGVIVFLALVLVGLITLYIKIRDKKSLFYLARVNGWAALIALVGLSTVDWDSAIVRYNLGHWNQGEIDVDNYLDMSDKVLPLLYADIDKVEAQMAKHRQNTVRWVDNLDIHDFRRQLDARRDRFNRRYVDARWQESSLADHRTARGLAALHESMAQ